MAEVTIPETAPSIAIVLPQAAPLVVELDGQLLRVGAREEAFFAIARRLAGHVWRNPSTLAAGIRTIHADLADQAAADVENWPVDEVVAAALAKQAALGRKIILLSDAGVIVNSALAARFPFISEVIAADDLAGMSKDAKARLLAERLPAGYSLQPIYESADAGGVGARTSETTAPSRSPVLDWRAITKCMRLHQWAKNVLVFLPFMLDGKASDPAVWMLAIAGFVALGLVASATYIVNDIWDLADDRRHWSKRGRPIASGKLPISQALLLAAGLAALGFGLAMMTNWSAVLLLGVYAAVTLGYTIGLKRVPILDVVILAGLFTLRLGFGMALTDARLSYWLLVFSMFVFTSLSAAKRHTELRRQVEKGVSGSGRGYVPADQPLLLGFGLAAMFSALLISVLYLIDDAFPSGFYSQPMYLWLVPVLMSLFLGRIWLLSQRGELRDDPVEFAVRDRASLALGLAMVVSLALAIVG